MISEIHDSVLTDAERADLDLFGDLLATELLEKVTGFRNRSFPLPVVFWIFLCQVLAGGSCRYGVASVQALLSRHGDRLNHWLPVMLSSNSNSVRRRLVTDLVEMIAGDQVPSRPFRREPRAIKRRPKPHQHLNVPRRQMIEISHRTRYKKTADEITPNDP